MRNWKKAVIGLLAICLVLQVFTIPAAAAGKRGLQTVRGKTYYYNRSGKKVRKKFVKVKRHTYYFGKTGAAYKGLKKIKKSYYYFDRKCRNVRNKVVRIKGKKYYFSKNGKAIAGTVKAGGRIMISTSRGYLKKDITRYSRNGADFDEFIKVAGKPRRSLIAGDSCLGDIPGKDGIYTYSNFTVYTFEAEGKRTITFVR